MNHYNGVLLMNKYTSLVNIDDHNDSRERRIHDRGMLIDTKNLLTLLSNSTRQNPVILPNNCRYWEDVTPNCSIFCIEQEPIIRTVKVNHPLSVFKADLKDKGLDKLYDLDKYPIYSSQPTNYRLSFPYILFIGDYLNGLVRNLYVFFRLAPLTNFYDYLLLVPLYNIDYRQRMCLGNYYDGGGLNTPERAVEIFWTNVFNTDYQDNVLKYNDRDVPEIRNPFMWQYHTLKDPNFIYSVEWIKYEMTFVEKINSMKDNIRASSEHTYRNLVSDVYDLGKIILSDNSKINFHNPNSSNQAYAQYYESDILNGTPITVGDSIEIKGKKYYVNGFKHDARTYSSIIILERESDGKILNLRLTQSLITIIVNYINNLNELLSITLPNGKIVKKGDVVRASCEGGNDKRYNNVKKIRKARDGEIEIQLDNNYVPLGFVGLDLFEVEEKYNGTDLIRGKEYFVEIMHTFEYSDPVFRLEKLPYDGFEMYNGSLRFMFAHRTLSMNTDYLLLSENDLFSDSYYIPKFIRLGHVLVASEPENSMFISRKDNKLILANKQNSGITLGRYGELSELLTNGILSIPSFDFNIWLGINDKVILDSETYSWKDGIHTIKDIKQDEESIDIECVDSGGFTRTVKYIEKRAVTTTRIYSWKVRKVVEKFLDIEVGMKATVKIAGIPSFLKGKTYEVMAIIVDTGGLPLILFHNGLTQWLDPNIIYEMFEFRSAKDSSHLKCHINNKPEGFIIGDLVEERTTHDSIQYQQMHIRGAKRFYAIGGIYSYYGRANGISNTIPSTLFKIEQKIGISSPKPLIKSACDRLMFDSVALQPVYPSLHNWNIPVKGSPFLLPAYKTGGNNV